MNERITLGVFLALRLVDTEVLLSGLFCCKQWTQSNAKTERIACDGIVWNSRLYVQTGRESDDVPHSGLWNKKQLIRTTLEKTVLFLVCWFWCSHHKEQREEHGALFCEVCHLQFCKMAKMVSCVTKTAFTILGPDGQVILCVRKGQRCRLQF